MQTDFKKRLAVVGGDNREVIVVKELINKGYSIKTFGLPASLMPSEVQVCPSFREATKNTDAVILPMPGINNQGILYTKLLQENILITLEDCAEISPKVPVFVGAASRYLKDIAKTIKFPLIEIADIDEIAIPNSIPTAEGAIQLAMEKLPITMHSSECLVIGYGRVGETLSAMLKGIGAKVTVCARNFTQLAKCQVLGYDTKTLDELPQIIEKADIIYNTVPFLIINEYILNLVRKEALIIDLASSPGGTDFKAAAELGISALLAPGLPGKVAPHTAGKILANAYPKIIESHIPCF